MLEVSNVPYVIEDHHNRSKASKHILDQSPTHVLIPTSHTITTGKSISSTSRSPLPRQGVKQQRLPRASMTLQHHSPAPASSRNVKPNYGTVPAHHHTYAPAHQDEEAAAAEPVSALDAAAAAAALQIDAAGLTTTTSRRRWVPGEAYLVLFVLLYSANNAVLAGLMAKG